MLCGVLALQVVISMSQADNRGSDGLRILVIGGSDAGTSAALRAREADSTADVRVIVADTFPNFSICGLPFLLSGEVKDWRALAHRTREDIEALRVNLRLAETATAIDPVRKIVSTRGAEGTVHEHSYDRLVIGTGASPVRPGLPGADLPEVFTLHTMSECFALQRYLDDGARRAVIVGGGYIGLEVADALRHRGLAVTLIEQLPGVLRTVDPPIGRLVEDQLREHQVVVCTSTAVEAIVRTDEGLAVRCAGGFTAMGDFVLMAVGVRPQSELAKSCGILCTERGAIRVDRMMRTSVPDIFAAGDCAVTWHRFLARDAYLPLGTTSHKQGRIAGENAVGGKREFAGSLGTQSVKLFDHVVAATGLRETEASAYGFSPLAIDIKANDHKAYYPGSSEMIVRIVGDRESGALLGAQLFGAHGKEVSKRIDIIAAALHQRMRVEELNDLDLSYTPPLSSPWDPLQLAAQAWMAAREHSR